MEKLRQPFFSGIRLGARASALIARVTNVFLLTAAMAGVVLAMVRAAYNVSLHTPLQMTTSGGEESALYGVWSDLHGLPIYTDVFSIPYSCSYYNWLFYAVYGGVGGITLHLLHLDDAWLPTACRLLTLLLTTAGCGIFLLALHWLGLVKRSLSLAIPTVLLALFNPLCGLWLFTTRSDMGAVVLELAGLAFFFRYLDKGHLFLVVLSALALYAAWAFKPTAVSAFDGISATLFLLGRWRSLALFFFLWAGAVLLTFAILGHLFWQNIYVSELHCGLAINAGFYFFFLALIKMPFIPLAFMGIVWLIGHFRDSPPLQGAELTILLVWLAALGLETPAIFKSGAADYYFIPLGVWSMLLLALFRRRLAFVWQEYGLILAATVMLLEIGIIFSGTRGTLDKRGDNASFQRMTTRLSTLPSPVFVQNTFGDLPWIQRHPPYFVLAFTYPWEKAAGAPFQDGGWEGLASQGYFGTLVLYTGSSFDPEATGHYRFLYAEDSYRYFERK